MKWNVMEWQVSWISWCLFHTFSQEATFNLLLPTFATECIHFTFLQLHEALGCCLFALEMPAASWNLKSEIFSKHNMWTWASRQSEPHQADLYKFQFLAKTWKRGAEIEQCRRRALFIIRRQRQKSKVKNNFLLGPLSDLLVLILSATIYLSGAPRSMGGT